MMQIGKTQDNSPVKELLGKVKESRDTVKTKIPCQTINDLKNEAKILKQRIAGIG